MGPVCRAPSASITEQHEQINVRLRRSESVALGRAPQSGGLTYWACRPAAGRVDPLSADKGLGGSDRRMHVRRRAGGGSFPG